MALNGGIIGQASNAVRDYEKGAKDEQEYVDYLLGKMEAVPIPNGYSHIAGSKDTGFVISDTDGNEWVWVPVEDINTFTRDDFGADIIIGGDKPTAGEFTEDTTTAEYQAMKASVEYHKGFYIARYEAGSTVERTTADDYTEPVSKKGVYPYNYIPFPQAITYKTNPEEVNKGDAVKHLIYGVEYDTVLKWIRDTEPNYRITSSDGWGNHNDQSFEFTGKYAEYTTLFQPFTTTVETKTKPGSTANPTSWLLTTGASERNKVKNIYDLSGNTMPWTQECSTTLGYRAMRGRVLS